MCHNCPSKFVVKYQLLKHLKYKLCGVKRNPGGRPKRQGSPPPRRKRAPKQSDNKRSTEPKNDAQKNPSDCLNVEVPVATFPDMNNSEEKTERVVCTADPTYLLPQQRAGQTSFIAQPTNLSLLEVVISQLDESLKYRIYLTFKDRMRSEILMLIRRQILNSNDFTSVVFSAERANLKTSEFIEAIIESFHNK